MNIEKVSKLRERIEGKNITSVICGALLVKCNKLDINIMSSGDAYISIYNGLDVVAFLNTHELKDYSFSGYGDNSIIHFK